MRKDFCLCFDEKYVPYAAVTIRSILDNCNGNNYVFLHLITHNVSEQSIRDLISLGGNMKFYSIDENAIANFPVTNEWSIATWFRLFIPELIRDVDRILYLDCDVIVNSSLDKLFSLDLNNISVAGCVDTQNYSDITNRRLGLPANNIYICAGVLMMNLLYWREHDIKDKIVSLVTSKRIKLDFLDQDAINIVCNADKLVLDPSYGVLPGYFLNNDFISTHSRDIIRILDKPDVIHYAGYQPWHFEKNKSPHSNIWWSTFRSLHKYPVVYKNFMMTILKYIVKKTLCSLSIISKDSRYSTSQYYNHPKIKRSDIEKKINADK